MGAMTERKGPCCQSCGLPLDARALFGTDAAELPVENYCIYCYHRGAFSEPAMSCEAMIERMTDLLVKEQHMSEFQARELAARRVPRLERWAHWHEHA